jgi:hypothetical protein
LVRGGWKKVVAIHSLNQVNPSPREAGTSRDRGWLETIFA